MKKFLFTYLLTGCAYAIAMLHTITNMPALISITGNNGLAFLIGYAILLWLPIIFWQLFYSFTVNAWQLVFVAAFLLILMLIRKRK